MYNLIVDLPRNLSSEILSKYLVSQEVGKLDSAFSSMKLREPFLELLSCPELKINDKDSPRFAGHRYLNSFNKTRLRWHVVRSVKIRCVHLTGETEDADESEIVQFMNVVYKNVEELTIHQLDISKWICNPHLSFTSVKILNWRNMPGRGEELAEMLRRAPNLNKLILTGNSALDAHYFQGCLFASLQNLRLIGAFDESDMSFLAQVFPNVRTLEVIILIFRNFKDPAGVISMFKQLQSLMLDDANKVLDADLIRIADSCPQLKTINIRNASQLTDISVTYLCSKCSTLESIKLSNSIKLTNTAIQAIGDNLSTTLRELTLSFCRAIDSCAALMSCRLLESLTLSTARRTPAIGLHELFECCPGLRSVHIRSREISDATLHALAHHCPQLRELTIHFCTGYTPAGLLELATYATLLRKLKISSGLLSAMVRQIFTKNGCWLVIVDK